MISLAALLLTAVLALLIARRRSRGVDCDKPATHEQATPDAAKSRTALEREIGGACRSGDASQAYRLMQQWFSMQETVRSQLAVDTQESLVLQKR